MIKFLFGFGGISTVAKVLKVVLLAALLALFYFFVMWSWHFIAQKEPKTKAKLKKINLQVDSLIKENDSLLKIDKYSQMYILKIDSARMSGLVTISQLENKEKQYQRGIQDLTKTVKWFKQNGACFERVKIKKGLFKSEFILVPIKCDSTISPSHPP